MLLAIDIGNTEITLGLFVGQRLTAHWRLTTVVGRTPDEWTATLTAFLTQAGYSNQEVRASVLASVAPTVTEALADGVSQAVECPPAIVGPESDLPIRLDVDEPLTVGADRVMNALAAFGLYHRDTIVVDFGTATTFDCVTGDGRFIGGVIAPGLRTAADQLTRRTAKLPATDLAAPRRVIGRRTEECIRSGVVYGATDSTDGLVRRIKREWTPGGGVFVVATGGLAHHIAPLSQEIDTIEPHLVLIGLRIAAAHRGLEW
jgi:type III pantothenate kinase